MSGNNQKKSGNETGTNRRRVNISIPPDLHDDCTGYAEDHGKSFSQLVRDGLLNEINPGQSNPSATQQQQVLKRLDTMSGELADIHESVEEANDQLENLSKTTELKIEAAAETIEEVLEDVEDPLTVPEIVDRVKFPPNQVKQALEKLHRQFVIERSGEHSETEDTQWRLV